MKFLKQQDSHQEAYNNGRNALIYGNEGNYESVSSTEIMAEKRPKEKKAATMGF